MARSAAAGCGSRQLILLGALAACCAVSAAAPPPDATGAAAKAQAVQTAQSAPADATAPRKRGAKAGAGAKRSGDAPDAAVLEYLGEFDEAGDGLDAMGLAGDDADTPKPAQGGRR